MAKYVLAVYDACQVYLERFLNYAGARGSLGFTVAGYNDLTILARDLQDNRIDAVLFSVDDVFMDFFGNKKGVFPRIIMNGMVVLFFGEQHSAAELKAALDERGYTDEIRIIEKYQSVENILAEADEYIQEKRGWISSDVDMEDLQVIGIYSPADKVTHPEMALELKKDMRNVLYISLEPFAGLDHMMDLPAQGDLSEALYCFRTCPSRLPESIRRIRGKMGGMDILKAPDNMDDLEELDGNYWPGFLKAASDSGDYQMVIVDIASFSWKIIQVILTYGSLYIPALPYDETRTFRSVLTSGAVREERRRERAIASLREFRKFFEEEEYLRYRNRILEVQFESG